MAGRGSCPVRLAGEQLVAVRRRISVLRDALLADREAAAGAHRTGAMIDRLAERKREATGMLRALRSVAAGAATATDWQSPSFGHAVHAPAGRFAGRARSSWTRCATPQVSTCPTSRPWCGPWPAR